MKSSIVVASYSEMASSDLGVAASNPVAGTSVVILEDKTVFFTDDAASI